jgi:hypothetical protein
MVPEKYQMSEFKFEAYGVKIGVRVNDERAIEKIKNILPFYSTPLGEKDEADHSFILFWNENENGEDSLYEGEVEIATRADPERLVALLDTCIRMKMGEFAPRHVFIHAGVVGWKGKAMIFPANSYSGKTTLVAELIKHGAIYYSDEYAVIDDQGLAHPYPKPLSMRKEGEYQQTDRTVAEMGGEQGIAPLPVGMVLLTEYDPAAEWEPKVLSEGEGILHLIPHSLAIRTNPQFVLNVLNLISKRAIIASSKRGNVTEFAKLILNFPDSHFFT